MSDVINWLPKKILKEHMDASRKSYSFINRDFETCLEYVTLDEKHLNVYSPRLADLILRIGPEVIRVFNLILFNQDIERFFVDNGFFYEPNLQSQIIRIQKKKEKRNDGLMDYLSALPDLKKENVKVPALGYPITPFEVSYIQIPNRKKPIESTFWWEYGYNALRHRIIREFKESATLKHALFSFAGLKVLHNRLNKDWGWPEGWPDITDSAIFK